MSLQGHRHDTRGQARTSGARHLSPQGDGLGTIVAVLLLSALLIVGVSYVMDPPPTVDTTPEIPPSTYRAQ